MAVDMTDETIAQYRERLMKMSIKEIQKKNDSKTLIKFPVLEGDSQIYLGQTIVTLVRMGIENNIAYSDETQHRFKVELMASVLSELEVSLDDLKKEYDARKDVTI